MAASPPDRPAPVDHPVLDVIATRWSSRAVDPQRPVPRALLLRMLEAARWAPSSGNAQPWRYLVFDDTVPDAREVARGCLSPGNAWAARAPVLLISLTSMCWPGSDDPNPSAVHDTGAANLCLILQGQHDGLIVHPMAGFDRDAVRKHFGVPDDVDPRIMIAVGWPGDPDQLDDRSRGREQRPRRRRPVTDFARLGGWDGAALDA